jgi:hypothetical protein
MLQIIWKDKDKEHPTKTVWINKATGELVTVVGTTCPEGCREPDLEETDKIFRNCYIPGVYNTGWKPYKPFKAGLIDFA